MNLSENAPADALESEIQRIEAMSLQDLRSLWATRWGTPPRFRSVDLLRRLVAWRLQAEIFGGLFGSGAALVLDEFALILHLRDVYWTSAGRVSIDAVFIAPGLTALLLFACVGMMLSLRAPHSVRTEHAS